MVNDLIDESEGLLKRLDKISKFGSKYHVYPYQEAGRLVEELRILGDSIPDIQNPQNQDELLQAEIKRRVNGEAASTEHYLTGKNYDFDTIISMYSIPTLDIRGLRPWLEANRDKTLEAIERLFKTSEVESYELGLPADIPSIRRQADEFAAVHIQRYHRRLGKLLEDLTNVGEFLRDINAVPTTEGRSYFNTLTNTLAIGIPAICYTTEDGSLHIREREL